MRWHVACWPTSTTSIRVHISRAFTFNRGIAIRREIKFVPRTAQRKLNFEGAARFQKDRRNIYSRCVLSLSLSLSPDGELSRNEFYLSLSLSANTDIVERR